MIASDLNTVAQSLMPYNSMDLVAAAGGMQLMPENADRVVRLEALAHVTAFLPSNPGGPAISTPRLRRAIGTPPFNGWLAQMEDPSENAFTEAFTFHGGSYIVFPGNAEDATFSLKNLARTLFLQPAPFPQAAFVEEARDLMLTVLALSDEIARRAGLERGVEPAGMPGDGIVVPDSQRLARLKRAVTFTLAECGELVRGWHIAPRILADLCTDQGAVSLDRYDLNSGPFYCRPLVRHGNTVIVAMPGMLLSALANAVLRSASKYGVLADLTGRFTEAVWQSVTDSFGHMDNPPVEGTPFHNTPAPCMREGLFSLDADKAVYALLLTDPLEDYDFNDMFAPMPVAAMEEVVKERLELARQIVFGPASPANGVLFLVLFQSYGRMVLLKTDAAAFRDADTCLSFSLTAAELETLALLEHGKQLALWKFARARAWARKQSDVLSLGTLNEYYYFRKQGYSYYWSDTTRYHMVTMPPGGAGELRREVIRQRDWHAAPHHSDANRVVEVTTFHSSRDIPLYVPLRDVRSQVAFWVEGASVPFWVVGPRYGMAAEGELHRHEYFTFAEAVAYWLWQLTPSLSPILTPLAAKHQFVLLRLRILTEEDWRYLPSPEQSGGIPAEVAPDAGTATLTVTLHPALGVLCGRHDNHGERSLVRTILHGMRALLPACSQDILSDTACEAILDRHAPLGPKKMLLFQTAQQTPQMDPAGIPPWRQVQEVDVSEVLDELGEYLRKVDRLPIGPLPDDQRVPILRDRVVGFFYRQLQEAVASLNPTALLERLVVYHEAVVGKLL